MFNVKNQTLPHNIRIEDAVFLGWQASSSGEVFALYNVTATGHPSRGSTVTAGSLLKLNLQIPETPLQPAKNG